MKKEINVTVNDVRYSVSCPEEYSLLKLLREVIGLTGTKEGCGAGECGACTVILNENPVNSCMVFALEADGAVVQTIEGEAENGELSGLQKAFVEHNAFHCGFCTPGMIMSARALLDKNPNPTKAEIVTALEGNLCRCTGYQAIIDAVESMKGGKFHD